MKSISKNLTLEGCPPLRRSLYLRFVPFTTFLKSTIYRVLLTFAFLRSFCGDCCSNHSKPPDLANCVTASPPKKSTTPKAPAKSTRPKEPKKPTTAKKGTESPTPKPKRKRQETKKVTKEPDRKILVAVDLWVNMHQQPPIY